MFGVGVGSYSIGDLCRAAADGLAIQVGVEGPAEPYNLV